jgi:hypothetical protein
MESGANQRHIRKRIKEWQLENMWREPAAIEEAKDAHPDGM